MSHSGDMWPNHDAGDDDEPDWVKTEREQFVAFRDKDGDKRMNRDEVSNWIMPADYDQSEAETRHLMFESDSDRVRVCTRDVSKRAHASNAFLCLSYWHKHTRARWLTLQDL